MRSWNLSSSRTCGAHARQARRPRGIDGRGRDHARHQQRDAAPVGQPLFGVACAHRAVQCSGQLEFLSISTARRAARVAMPREIVGKRTEVFAAPCAHICRYYRPRCCPRRSSCKDAGAVVRVACRHASISIGSAGRMTNGRPANLFQASSKAGETDVNRGMRASSAALNAPARPSPAASSLPNLFNRTSSHRQQYPAAPPGGAQRTGPVEVAHRRAGAQILEYRKPFRGRDVSQKAGMKPGPQGHDFPR